MAYKGSLAFSPAGIDACALWRMWMPHLNIANSRFLFSEGMPAINEMAECDTIVVQRLMMAGNVKFLQIARAYGFRIIYDLDDAVWTLPKSNPAYQIFNAKESVDGLRNCAEWADVITVSTRELQKVVEHKYSDLRNAQTNKQIPVVHIDNAVDTNLFQRSFPKRDDDRIVVGWGGSNTHAGDVKYLWEILPAILERYENVYMEFAGMDGPISIRNHPRVKHHGWCHVSEYHNRYATWDWDIVLAPLEDHKFNYSKSCIKMIEAGCIAKPCLAQDIAPYKYFCKDMPDLKWLLCENFEWEKKLHRLIQDKPFREDLGAKMYENVIANFDVKRTAIQWEELAYTILK